MRNKLLAFSFGVGLLLVPKVCWAEVYYGGGYAYPVQVYSAPVVVEYSYPPTYYAPPVYSAPIYSAPVYAGPVYSYPYRYYPQYYGPAYYPAVVQPYYGRGHHHHGRW